MVMLVNRPSANTVPTREDCYRPYSQSICPPLDDSRRVYDGRIMFVNTPLATIASDISIACRQSETFLLASIEFLVRRFKGSGFCPCNFISRFSTNPFVVWQRILMPGSQKLFFMKREILKFVVIAASLSRIHRQYRLATRFLCSESRRAGQREILTF